MGEDPTQKLVFTDYMYKYDVTLNKLRIIIMVTERHLYVLQINNY